MSRDGHRMTAAALAAMTFAIAPTPAIVPVVFGILVGSSAPDDLEIARYDDAGERRSLVPHRTLTHWGLAWVVVFAALVALAWFAYSALLGIAVGYASAALVHLLVDTGGGRGIPWLWPTQRIAPPRRLYSNDARSEWMIRAAAAIAIAATVLLRWPQEYAALLPWWQAGMAWIVNVPRGLAEMLQGHAVNLFSLVLPAVIAMLVGLLAAWKAISTTKAYATTLVIVATHGGTD